MGELMKILVRVRTAASIVKWLTSRQRQIDPGANFGARPRATQRLTDRRRAFLDLLIYTDALAGKDPAALELGAARLDQDSTLAFRRVRTLAELYASAEGWSEMEPYVRAVSVMRKPVGAELSPSGGETAGTSDGLVGRNATDGLDRLRYRYLLAVRRELDLDVDVDPSDQQTG